MSLASKPAITFKNEVEKYGKQVKKSLRSVMPKLQKEVPEQIRTRTRLGNRVDHNFNDRLGGKTGKFDKLSNKYKRTRRKLKNNLDPKTTPAKSNLTATGQLLDSIKARRRGRTGLLIYLEKQRRVDLRGNPATIDNVTLAEYVEEKRPFFALSDGELNKFRRMIRDKILSDLNKVK